VQRADDHHSSAQRPANLLLSITHATRKSSRHARALWMQIAQDVLAHGE
jgi:hypothetical protein